MDAGDQDDQNKEKELLAGISAGDERAFSRLYQEYYGAFFHFTNRIVQNHPEAQHIVSHSFEKLWKLKAGFKAIADIRAFMYVTCRNASYDYLRGSKRSKVVLTDDVQEMLKDDSKEENILHEIIRTELLNDVYLAIKELPPQQKAVIDRIFLQDFTTEEVAQSLGISNESVRSHKRHALNQLRKTIRIVTVFLSFLQAGG